MSPTCRTEQEWYARHNCSHGHCPLGCLKPQPALAADGRMLCMKCLVLSGVVSEVVPCTPETCEEAA